ncbi:MAG TPA: chorismate-binding protein [Rectinemataceae bacterium]|nr:chorismate-binding protein [Rectinemataceae bacterium]
MSVMDIDEFPKSGSIAELLALCVDRRLSFAAWRLPGEEDRFVAIQKDNRPEEVAELHELLDSGAFVVAPFRGDGDRKRFAIRPDILVRNSLDAATAEEILALPGFPEGSLGSGGGQAVGFEDYLEQVRGIVDAIRGGSFDKVVLSRVKTVEGRFRPRLGELFELLCEAYAKAFVYLFQVEGECWIGASPEVLLSSRGDRLVTVSLAGTRPYSEANRDVAVWNGKERAEQDHVTRQIEGILREFSVEGVARSELATRRAGNLLHLCSEFAFPYAAVASRLGPFVEALHPTSAVCGIPRAGAMELIAAIEGHERGYYAGYLGPVGPLAGSGAADGGTAKGGAADGAGDVDGATAPGGVQLFVNLRCMRVSPERLELFVGGGITAGSVPEDEWEETEMKARTLLSIIEEVS